jgi:short-subunit dehydrogenase
MTARSILITGASSGIGRALALEYARAGVTLALTGRDAPRLDTVAALCRASGATVNSAVLDVTDAPALARWIAQADAAAPLDLVIANAGIGAGLDETSSNFDIMRQMIEVNLIGALNTLEPALGPMRARRRGHVVLMGSIAALRGIPGSQGYCATKAALRALAEGLRPQLAAEGIGISLVMPGFVRTPMNEGRGFPTPMRIEPDHAARLIRRAVDRRRFLVVFPVPLWWGARLLGLFPWLSDALALRAAHKKG